MEGTGESAGMSTGGLSQGPTGSFDTGGMEMQEGPQTFGAFEETQTDAVSNQVEVAVGSEQSLEELVSSRASAHDKLVSLSEMEDVNELEAEKNLKTDGEPEKQANQDLEKDPAEPSLEQKVMLLQAEALKFLAGRSVESNEREKDELLKKLKELIEAMQESDESVSAKVLAVILGLFMFLSKTGEKGTNFLDEEAKRAEGKN